MYVRKARKWSDKARDEITTKLLVYLKDHPCVDCGEDDPIVLTFDHVRGRKSDSIARLASRSGASWSRIEREIKKCQVRCANCHARRTAKQFGWRKLRLLAGEA